MVKKREVGPEGHGKGAQVLLNDNRKRDQRMRKRKESKCGA